MSKYQNKILAVIKGLLVFFFFYHSVFLQYIPLYLFHIDINSLSNNYRMAALFTTFSDLIVLFVLLLVYRKDLFQEIHTYLKDFKKNFEIGLSCWGVGLIIMVVSNLFLTNILHSDGPNNENLVRELIHSYPFIMALDVCLIGPTIEELVFRKTFKDIFKNPYLLVGASFLAFGLAHVVSMATTFTDWLYILPYGALGGAFAYAYYKTDSIFTSLVLHMLHNTFVMLLVLMI